ncbi:hypothetical protein [Spirosoma aerophilum]
MIQQKQNRFGSASFLSPASPKSVGILAVHPAFHKPEQILSISTQQANSKAFN